jgi:hypothetical protein
LFSYLTWGTTRLLGISELTVRLWALLPGLAGAVLLAWWLGRRLGWWLALAVAGFMLVSPLHVTLVTEARGYGLVLLSAVGLLIGAVEVADGRGWRAEAVLVSSAIVGCLTVPSFVIPVSSTAVLLTTTRARLRWRRWCLLGGGTAALVLLWYAPLLEAVTGRIEAVGARWGVLARPVSGLLAPTSLLGSPTTEHLLPGLPGGVVDAATAGLAVIGAAWLWRRDRTVATLVVGVPILCIAALVALRFHLLDRYLAYLYPLVAVAWAAGAVAVVTWMRGRSRAGAHLAVTLALVLLTIGAWRTLPEVTRVPRQDFLAVSRLAEKIGPEQIVLAAPHIGFTYYLADHRVVVLEHGRALEAHLCEADAPLLYVEAADRIGPHLPCLHRRGFVRHEWRQRSAPGTMSAWVLR